MTAGAERAASAPSGDLESLTARAFWLILAKTLSLALSIALPLVLVRQMSQGEFGLYKQAFLLITTAHSILPLGFAMSAFYFFPREPERRKQVVLNILLFHLFVGAAAATALLVSPGLLTAIFHGPELVAYAPWMALTILLWSASTFLEFVVIANKETRLAAILIGALQFSKAVLLVGAALVFETLEGLLLAAAVQGAVQLLLVLAYLGSRFRGFFRRFDASLMKSQLAYALPHGGAALLWWAHLDLHRYFVAHRFDAAVFAIYAIGCFQLPILGILSESVGSVMIPRVSELQASGRIREILLLIARTVRKLAGVYVPLAAFLVLAAREIIVLLFTDRYLASVPIFRINAAVIPLIAVGLSADAVVRAYGEHRYYVLKLRILLTAILVTGLWFAVGRFGLIGAISVVAGVEILERAWLAIKVGRILGFERRDRGLFGDLPKIAVATAAGSVVAWLFLTFWTSLSTFAVLAASGTGFALVYLGVLVLWKVPTEAELDLLRAQARRVGLPTRLRRFASPGFDTSAK